MQRSEHTPGIRAPGHSPSIRPHILHISRLECEEGRHTPLILGHMCSACERSHRLWQRQMVVLQGSTPWATEGVRAAATSYSLLLIIQKRPHDSQDPFVSRGRWWLLPVKRCCWKRGHRDAVGERKDWTRVGGG